MSPLARSGTLGVFRSLNLLALAPLAARAPIYGRLLWALLRDDRIPAAHKAVLGLAAGYLISPVDLVPEWIPGVGALDDLVVVALALDVFLEHVPEEVLAQTLHDLDIDRRELDRDLGRVRRLVPRPVRAAAMGLPRTLERAAALLRGSGLDRRLRRGVERAVVGEDVWRARHARRVNDERESTMRGETTA